jgi:hypothetical protein
MRKQLAIVAFICSYGSASMIISWKAISLQVQHYPHTIFNLRPFSACPERNRPEAIFRDAMVRRHEYNVILLRYA